MNHCQEPYADGLKYSTASACTFTSFTGTGTYVDQQVEPAKIRELKYLCHCQQHVGNEHDADERHVVVLEMEL